MYVVEENNLTSFPSSSTLPPMLEHPTTRDEQANAPANPSVALPTCLPKPFYLRSPAPGYDWCCWRCGYSWRSSKPNAPPPSKCPNKTCKSGAWWWQGEQQVEQQVQRTWVDTVTDWQERQNRRLGKAPAGESNLRELVGMPLPPPPSIMDRMVREPVEPQPENLIVYPLRSLLRPNEDIPDYVRVADLKEEHIPEEHALIEEPAINTRVTVDLTKLDTSNLSQAELEFLEKEFYVDGPSSSTPRHDGPEHTDNASDLGRAALPATSAEEAEAEKSGEL